MTVVVVTWNGLPMLQDCVRSLLAQDLESTWYRILVVDNGSTDGTLEWLHDQPQVEVAALSTNTGFAGGVTAGLAAVDTPYVALLNNDAVAARSWLRELLAPFENPMVGATTSKILLAGRGPAVIQSVGVQLDAGGRGSDRGYGELDRGQFDDEVDAWGFCGGAAALRMDAVMAVGGFWDRLFLYYEDVDVSWRLRRAGYRVALAPRAVVTHRHGASTRHGSDLFHFFNLRNRVLVVLANESWREALVRLCAPANRVTGSAPASTVADRRSSLQPAPTRLVKARAAISACWLAPEARRRRPLPQAHPKIW